MTEPVTYSSQIIPALVDMGIFFGLFALVLRIGMLIERRKQQGVR